jgi:hypothetical protein
MTASGQRDALPTDSSKAGQRAQAGASAPKRDPSDVSHGFAVAALSMKAILP